MKVSFLTPTNQKIVLNYFDVDEFCKNICFQPENKVEFQKFSRKYRYFYPYFDFVVQHLGYIFQNPLFLSNKSLLFKNKVYYLIDNLKSKKHIKHSFHIKLYFYIFIL